MIHNNLAESYSIIPSMGEIVRLHHPNGSVFDQVRIISRSPLNRGGTEPKELVTAALIGSGNSEKETTFVCKKPRPQMFLENNGINLDPKENPAGTYGAIWWELMQRGLPVVPYLRIASNTEVFMTNLRADGSEVYSQDRFFRGQIADPLDQEFAKIPPENIAINSRMIALGAYLEGVRLPSDGPLSLVLHPDKTWELTILDLTKTQFVTHPNKSVLERNYDDVFAEVTLLTLLQQKIKDSLSAH